ncbi:periplasmic phosphate-binding protein of phosphate ABC transporter [Calothrix sp. NIES-4071]|nr:periplasmic phosphate-binding protein of phosphate ABC transporter [Calothrix sp. NIES-4071]BAZ62007.1 periplasmic phosphate-binding protein of phosphate ABC transporter [Calothrix sp. NIES-4105]
MSQQHDKNETAILIIAFLTTLGLVCGGAFLWFKNPRIVSVSNGSTQQIQSNTNGFTSITKVPTGLFNYGGSTTWATIRRDVDSVIQKELPQFQLRYTEPITGAPGSSPGIRMLIQGQLAFSQSSRQIKAEEQSTARSLGFELVQIPVAIDGIAIAVNPNIQIPGLTVAQIKNIYTGKIKNWQQLGGPNLPITPYSRRLEDGGTIEFFHDNVLNKENFGANVQFVSTTTDGLRQLERNKGGIYYASAPEVVGQCQIRPLPIGRQASEFIPPYKEPFVQPSECPTKRNQINVDTFKTDKYPITRRLFVIVKQNDQSDQQVGMAYASMLLTEQGQKLISKSGFVRIR